MIMDDKMPPEVDAAFANALQHASKNELETLRGFFSGSRIGEHWSQVWQHLNREQARRDELAGGIRLEGGGACPEQYDAYIGERVVGYLRLRHGHFRVDYPDCGGETIYEAAPHGDGEFVPHERDYYLAEAKLAIVGRIERGEPKRVNDVSDEPTP